MTARRFLLMAAAALLALTPSPPGAAEAGFCPAVSNTRFFTIVYGTVTLGGSDALAGTVVEVRSPRGAAAGCSVVTQAGQYGAMYVYGEDNGVVPPLPGMRAGEPLAFFVNGGAATATPALTWANDLEPHAAAVSRAQAVAFTMQPVRGAHGVALGAPPDAAGQPTPQPVAALTDGQGQVQTGDSSTVVNLSIAAGTGAAGASLVCTGEGGTAKTAAAGIAAFSNCKIDRPGAGYVLEAAAAGFATARTAPFNVTWAGDATGDCRVSALDYSLVVTHFDKTDAHADWRAPAKLAFRADLNGDGRVSAADFSLMVSNFGTATASCAPASDGTYVAAP